MSAPNFKISRNEFNFSGVIALTLFIWILLERNNVIRCYLRYDILFSFGRYIPLIFTAYAILQPLRFSRLNWLKPLGKATYEIYLLHGLSCYMYTYYFLEYKNPKLILLFFFLIPTSAGILLHKHLTGIINFFATFTKRRTL
mgnify:CR=1 FL=1